MFCGFESVTCFKFENVSNTFPFCLFSESRFKVQTKVIAVDFTHADIYETIGKELNGLDIGILGKFETHFMQNSTKEK